MLLDSDLKASSTSASRPAIRTMRHRLPRPERRLRLDTITLSHTPEESFRDFAVSDDGAIVARCTAKTA